MAEVSVVYREVQVLKKPPPSRQSHQATAISVPTTKRPGIRPSQGCNPIAAQSNPWRPRDLRVRDYEYKVMARLSLLAGIDLLTGKVPAPRQEPALLCLTKTKG